jgi:hypothetical protein
MGPVEVNLLGRPPREGYLASIGRGGLGLYLGEQVAAPQLLLVNLRLAAGEADEELKLAARVRWARAAGSLWMAGVAFEQMSDARYERLLRHLKVIEHWQLGPREQERPESRMRFTVKE